MKPDPLPAIAPFDANSPTPETRDHAFGPFVVETGERRLLRDGQRIALTTKAFDILVILIESAGHLLTRDELIRAAWPTTIVEENNLSWYVSALRKALGENGDSARYIETVRGHGYRFVAPVTTSESGSLTNGRRAESACSVEDAAAIAPSSALSPAPAPEPTFEPRTLSLAPPRSRMTTNRRMAALFAIVAASIVVAVAWLVSARRGSITATLPPRSVAVLPFAYLGTNRDDAYFAEGVRDTILTKLAAVRSLKVIARTSTANLPNRPDDPAAIARELGVGTMLEGSVQKSGDKLLINVQLIDPATRAHRWAQIYERPLEDVFGVETDVAAQVATALEAELLPDEAAQLANAPTGDPEAYDLFLKAEYLAIAVEGNTAHDPSAEAQRARDFYRQAVARDPKFALAYARMAYLAIYRYHWFDADDKSLVADADAAAAQALRASPGLPQGHLAEGYVRYWGKHDFAGALSEFEQTLTALPNDADALGAVGYIAFRQGRWQVSLDHFERAALCDPRNPWWPDQIGVVLMQLGRYDHAIEQYDRALSIEPNHNEALIRKARTFLLMGKLGAARSTLAAATATADAAGESYGLAFAIAMAAHDGDAALAALAGAPATFDIGTPVELLRADALALKGDKVGAQAAYRAAETILRGRVASEPRASQLWGMLGQAQAALGERDDAIASGERAMALLGPGDDAFRAPFHLVVMADIRARLGQNDASIDLLQRALAMPSGVYLSAPLLRIDPTWDGLRNDPRFAALLTEQGVVAR